MTANEIFDLINKHPVFHLATMDGDQPRVRGMLGSLLKDRALVIASQFLVLAS